MKFTHYALVVFVLALIGGFASGILGSVLVLPHIISDNFFPSATSQSAGQIGALSTVALVDMVSPAVVSIVVEQQIVAANDSSSFIEDFFSIPVSPEDEGKTRRVGAGSGFVISEDGMILTNRHVVQAKDASYFVFFNDGSEYEAEVLAVDPLNDIAILDIDRNDSPFVTLGNSDDVKIGQPVVAIGNALGEYQNSVTKGIVSGVNRRIVAGNGMGSETIDSAIQTDAAINSGNSGGPLLDEYGRVIGINTAVSRQGQSIGFAIPINTAKIIVDSYQEYGRIVRPWLGVHYVMVDKEFAQENQLDVDYGALIVPGTISDPGVVKDSPADRAGLRERDIILRFDGVQVDMTRSLSSIISSRRVGDTIAVDIWRDGAEQTITVTLEELSSDAF